MKLKFATLHLSVPFISNPSDILAYVVRHYFETPSNIYESFLEFEYTFSKQLAKYQHTPEQLQEVVSRDLQEYLGQIFDLTTLSIDVQINYVKRHNTDKYKDFYELIINLSVTYENITYNITPNITIDKDFNFEINFSDV